jgi:hypothetical protein
MPKQIKTANTAVHPCVCPHWRWQHVCWEAGIRPAGSAQPRTLRPRESAGEYVDLFVDGRMSAETMRVLACDQPTLDTFYKTTLFSEDQAYRGSCTAKSTVYTASIAAGLMVSQFTRWLRGLPVDRDITLNLLSAELIAA